MYEAGDTEKPGGPVVKSKYTTTTHKGQIAFVTW